MRYRAAVGSFLAISLALLLCVPAAHLSDAKTRALAQAHWTQRDHQGWAKVLFNADVLEASLAATVWRYGISTDAASVVIGYNGWLHLGDAEKNTLSATRGDAGTPQRRQYAIDTGNALLAWEPWLKAQGVQDLVFMIGPNKGSVYPDTLPAWSRPGSNDPLAALSETAPAIVLDLRQPLRKAASQSAHPLYYVTDTHWNQLGAMHAFLQLGERLRDIDPGLDWPLHPPLKVSRVRQKRGGDLAHFLRLQMQMPETEINVDFRAVGQRISTVVDMDSGEKLLQSAFPTVDFPTRTVLASTPDALNPRRVLWVKDSFGGAISPLMAATFDQVVQLHYHSPMVRDPARFAHLVTQWRPQLLIFTVVEREAFSAFRQWTPPTSFSSF